MDGMCLVGYLNDTSDLLCSGVLPLPVDHLGLQRFCSLLKTSSHRGVLRTARSSRLIYRRLPRMRPWPAITRKLVSGAVNRKRNNRMVNYFELLIPTYIISLVAFISVNSTTKSPKPLKRPLSAYAIWVKENKESFYGQTEYKV